METRGRILIALGGNAISPAGGAGTADETVANVGDSMRAVADLVVDGWQVVLTHGNGPQVGDLVHRDELNASVAPPYPLDWAVAETQATIGHVLANVLGCELVARERSRPVVPVVSRVLVDRDDDAFAHPTKPIGPYVEDEADVTHRRDDLGQAWAHIEGKGWRRVVPSPEPVESLELASFRVLHEAGAIVIANGGGGIPTIRQADGRLEGAAAVIDKDLAGAMLAHELDVDTYVILTDVAGVAVDFGTDAERWLGEVTVSELRQHQADGQFPAGSMDPKVEAACRFVESGGHRAVIGALADAASAVAGSAGTQVRPG